MRSETIRLFCALPLTVWAVWLYAHWISWPWRRHVSVAPGGWDWSVVLLAAILYGLWMVGDR